MITGLVSIIVPSYNRAHLIGETLESIIDQTYINWECIIVDDGSTDNTAKVVEAYCKKDSRFQYHLRPKDRLQGGNAARNYGFEKSKGEYVNWFDSDDIMLPNFLAEKLRIFNSHPNLDAVLAYGAYFENNITNVDIKKPKLDLENVLLDYVSSKLIFATPGPLWKKSFLDGQNLFDEERLKIQDTEFHFRMLIEGMDFKFYEPDFLFLIRRGDDRISAKKTLSLKKLEAVFDYHYFTLVKGDEVSKQREVEKYIGVTSKNTRKAFYEMIICQNSLLSRYELLKKYYSKIRFAISKSKKSKVLKVNIYIGLILTIIFKKGYSLLV
ncbi:glycosyltransferase family 2 protein [Winogradskyella wichelsiae]|uniref:glycosyltransferase family 2 protein n=1 Tax=Winogradskyella wichelsiae TaxID=2697007 RepID=UPI003EF0EEF8